MNGIARIDRINKLTTAPERHRAECKPLAERVAAEVEAEIARLRTFAGHKPGRVADTCNVTADLLEAELEKEMAKFDTAEERAQRIGNAADKATLNAQCQSRTAAINPSPEANRVAADARDKAADLCQQASQAYAAAGITDETWEYAAEMNRHYTMAWIHAGRALP